MMRRISALLAMAMVASSCAFVRTGQCGGTQVQGEFREVGDLVQAATVQSADVEIGSVTDIKLDKENWIARVTMCIDEGIDIGADAEAIVRSTSLLGEKFIDLRADETPGGPLLQDGDVIPLERTSKAAELEEVFAKLASVLGTGNLEQINRFTTAQANILRDHTGDLKTVLRDLRKFTDLLAERRRQVAAAIDGLDATARTLLADSGILTSFLDSFAGSSAVLADQKESLSGLLVSLDRFTEVSLRLLDVTEEGLNRQFRDLRPVLRTLVANSQNIRRTLTTLAVFSKWFPETMPGDYLQLDVCQAGEHDYDQGTNCPQSKTNDDPSATSAPLPEPDNAAELFFQRAIRGGLR